MEKPVYWLSPVPEQCDLCHKAINTVFVDGRTRMGPWACMCLYCHRTVGNGLGTGRGQLFRQQPDKRWMKEPF